MNISDQVKEIIDLVQQAPLTGKDYTASSSGMGVFYESNVLTILRIANEAITMTVECNIDSGTATVKIRDIDVDRAVKTVAIDELENVLGEVIVASGLVR